MASSSASGSAVESAVKGTGQRNPIVFGFTPKSDATRTPAAPSPRPESPSAEDPTEVRTKKRRKLSSTLQAEPAPSATPAANFAVDQFTKRFLAMEQKIERLVQAVDESGEREAALKAKLTKRRKATEEEMEKAFTKISTLSETVKALEVVVTSMQTSIDVRNLAEDDKFTVISQRCTQLEESVAAQTTAPENSATKITAVETDISNLTRDLDLRRRADISTGALVTGIKNDLVNVDGQIVQLQKRFDAFESHIVDLTTQSIQAGINTARASFVDLARREAQQSIAEARDSLVKSTIENLERGRDAAGKALLIPSTAPPSGVRPKFLQESDFERLWEKQWEPSIGKYHQQVLSAKFVRIVPSSDKCVTVERLVFKLLDDANFVERTKRALGLTRENAPPTPPCPALETVKRLSARLQVVDTLVKSHQSDARMASVAVHTELGRVTTQLTALSKEVASLSSDTSETQSHVEGVEKALVCLTLPQNQIAPAPASSPSLDEKEVIKILGEQFNATGIVEALAVLESDIVPYSHSLPYLSQLLEDRDKHQKELKGLWDAVESADRKSSEVQKREQGRLGEIERRIRCIETETARCERESKAARQPLIRNLELLKRAVSRLHGDRQEMYEFVQNVQTALQNMEPALHTMNGILEK